MAKFHYKLTCLAWFFLLSTTTTLHRPVSARTLANPPRNRHHNHHSIAFYMPNVLSNTLPSSTRPATTKVNGQVPFSKPLGFFPPTSGIPSNPIPTSFPTSELPTQTMDLPGIGISFPATSTLQEELEFGMVTPIEVDLLQSLPVFDSQSLGKANGMYVASSDDGSSHMMAMTASLVPNEFKDRLRFYGVHRTDVSECHVAVIGGTGKYDGANGYATIKTVNVSSKSMGKEDGADNKKFLLFNVYLG